MANPLTVRRTRPRRNGPQRRVDTVAAAAIVATMLLAAGCSSDGEVLSRPQPSSEQITGDGSAADAGSTTATTGPDVAGQAQGQGGAGSGQERTPTSTTSSLPPVTPASPEQVRAFLELAPTLERVGPGVVGFAAVVEPDRVGELAGSACATVRSDMTDSRLGLTGLAAYDTLTPAEQSEVAEADWVVFYGALVGFFCPEKLPLGTLEDAPPTEGTDLEQFRAVISSLDGVSAEAEAFVAGLTDERLDGLQIGACTGTTGDMNNEEFGSAIVSSYGGVLTGAERRAVSLSGYGELYGALVGWFCPANLPL